MTNNTINDAMTIAGNGEGMLLANRYRVVRQLGQGGMGSVWLAEDTQLDNKPFAIKMLPSILVSNKRAYRQLKDEALVAMRLVHPNIVQIRAFEENNGNPFLVMDYIDGQTLDDYLAEHTGTGVSSVGKSSPGTTGILPVAHGLPEADVLRILRPIAAALDYAHTKGVVHRDVKPGNVMIAKDGTPYILDFGIAREIQETLTRVTGKLSSGTLLYMSPEQLHGASPKPAQDIYSFAAMAYECLKGEPPFVRGQIEFQIDNDRPEPLSGGPRSCAAAVMAGLAKKPENRPATCADVLLVRERPVVPKVEPLPTRQQEAEAIAHKTSKGISAQKVIPRSDWRYLPPDMRPSEKGSILTSSEPKPKPIPSEDWRYLPPEMRSSLGGNGQDGQKRDIASNAPSLGGPRPVAAVKGGPRSVATVKGILAAAALGLAAFGVWWWVNGREGTKWTQGTREMIGTNVTNVVQVSSGPSVASPAPAPAAKPATPERPAPVVFKAGHKGVQLWEGGPYWAETNIGAEKPEDYGYYFWWGDTVGYKREGNSWVASDGSSRDFSFDSEHAPTQGKSFDELKRDGWLTEDGVLAPKHDAAHKQWSNGWRMPTKQELDNLVNNCDWTWTTTVNGVKGYEVRGRGTYVSKSIFLPCAGYGDGTSLGDAGSYGYYWSSVPDSGSDYDAWLLYFYSSYHDASNYHFHYRNYGQSVRPVQGFTK